MVVLSLKSKEKEKRRIMQTIHPENHHRGTETLSLITAGYEKLCAYVWRGSVCFIAAAFCIALVQMLIV